MAESSGDDKSFWPDWMTPRRAWEFVKNVAALEQTVTELREENREVRIEVARLQQQVVEQNAQLSLLTQFVRDSLSGRLETRLDQIAAKLAARKDDE